MTTAEDGWYTDALKVEEWFADQVTFVQMGLTKNCEPSDFESMLRTYVVLKHVLKGSSPVIEDIVEAAFAKHPTLRKGVENFKPPESIVTEPPVAGWLQRGESASKHFVRRMKYFVIRVAMGDEIDQHRLAKAKASFTAIVDTTKAECELLDRWFGTQLKDTTDNTPKGVERPTDDEPVKVVSGISMEPAKRRTVQRSTLDVGDLQAASRGKGKARAGSLEAGVEVDMQVEIHEDNMLVDILESDYTSRAHELVDSDRDDNSNIRLSRASSAVSSTKRSRLTNESESAGNEVDDEEVDVKRLKVGPPQRRKSIPTDSMAVDDEAIHPMRRRGRQAINEDEENDPMQETAKKSQPQSTKKAKGKAKQSQKQKGNKLAEQATSSSVQSTTKPIASTPSKPWVNVPPNPYIKSTSAGGSGESEAVRSSVKNRAAPNMPQDLHQLKKMLHKRMGSLHFLEDNYGGPAPSASTGPARNTSSNK